MDERREMEKAADEVILPGFRFHPTDEELVGFYLRRKIQQKALSIELIRQLDIYKYDPWDLPKLATSGEKEWYFYCPRDRKYRNSARPNRVTGAGFWKATGTDRPIYSSEGSTKCIGLKKSLVFYRGRAARGTKTDWMMHEFRLPSLTDTDTSLPKRPLDKNIPANDSWAICRIFKKTNSMAQRALISQSWVSPLPEATDSDLFSVARTMNATQFGSENVSCTTTDQVGSSIQFGYKNGSLQQYHNSAITYPSLDVTTNSYNPNNFMFSPVVDMPVAAMLLSMSPSPSTDFVQQQQQFNGLTVDLPLEHIGNEEEGENKNSSSIDNSNDYWGSPRSAVSNFPFNLPSNVSEEWKANLAWDSPTCPSETSTNKSYT